MIDAVTAEGLERCRRDPGLFAREILGVDLLPEQSEMACSVRDHRRTATRSCFGFGKTFGAAAIVLWFLYSYPDSRVVTTGPSWDHVEKILWPKLASLWTGARVRLGGRLLNTELIIAPEWRAYGRSTDNPDAFRGAHNVDQLTVLDDAQGVRREIWDATRGLMSGTGTRLLAVGNPIVSAGPFYDAFRSQLWHGIRFDGLRHPNVIAGREIIPGAITREYVDDVRRQFGENSSKWLSDVRGEFPEDATDALIARSWLEAMKDRQPATKDGRHMGVDVARQGTDWCVASFMVDRKLEAQEKWQSPDTMPTVGRIQNLAGAWRIDGPDVHVDGIGIGAGVVDRCRELGLHVDDVQFGAEPAGDWRHLTGSTRFKNRKAELHWAMRCALRAEDLCIPESYGETWEDLLAPRYTLDSQGRIAIEEKEDLKRRIGRSPDCGDSIILALSRRGSLKYGRRI